MNAREQVVDATQEAEQSVLGAILIDNNAFDAIDGLKADHFWHYRHRKIFTAISKLIVAGREADMMSVYEHMSMAGMIVDEDGVLPYLNALVQNTPGAGNAKRYAAMVMDRSKLRALARAGADLQEVATSPHGKSIEEMVAKAQSEIDAIAVDDTAGPTPMGPILTEVVEEIDAFYHGAKPTGLSTGLRDLDEQLNGGPRPGNLVIVAGRPGMGKTAIALGLAEAAERTAPPLFFTGEMPCKELGQRALARASGLPLDKVITGKLVDADWPLLTYGVQKLAESTLLIDDTSGITLAQIAARARRQKRQGGLSCIVIDYLQIMGMDEAETRTIQIAKVTRGLKSLAKQLGVPVYLLAQLNRKVEERKDKRPMNSDLRESGDIEQDADVIIMLYRDELYSPDSPDRGTIELLVTKNRNGALGTVLATYIADRTLAVDRARPGEY